MKTWYFTGKKDENVQAQGGKTIDSEGTDGVITNTEIKNKYQNCERAKEPTQANQNAEPSDQKDRSSSEDLVTLT